MQEGRRRLELMRPYAARHDLTMLQLACLWNLGQPGVRCVVPTLIQEPGKGARAVEDKRAELAALDHIGVRLDEDELRAIRELGDNAGCMTLKGASSEYEGLELPDRWPLNAELGDVAARWGIDPARDLVRHEPMPAAG